MNMSNITELYQKLVCLGSFGSEGRHNANADIPVWRISSTLKLANYLASGLVIGPFLPGNGSK